MKNKKYVNIKRNLVLLTMAIVIILCISAIYKHYYDAMTEKRVIATYGNCIEEWKDFYDREAAKRGKREFYEDPQGEYERAYCYCLANIYVNDRGFNPDKENFKAYRGYTYTQTKDDTEKLINNCVKERLKIEK